MEHINEVGYRMHYYRALDMYTGICEDLGVEPSQKSKEVKEIKGSFSVKYTMIKAELRKLLKENVYNFVKEETTITVSDNIVDAGTGFADKIGASVSGASVSST